MILSPEVSLGFAEKPVNRVSDTILMKIPTIKLINQAEQEGKHTEMRKHKLFKGGCKQLELLNVSCTC
jgi:hypothetical protein